MPIVYASIMPHGDEIVPELVNKFDADTKELYLAADKAAGIMVDKKPDLIVIASPHNLRLYEHIGIIATEFLSGELRNEYGCISVKARVDRDFSKKLYNEANKNVIPVILVNYGTSGGELSSMCLDWGTIIPLWFIKRRYIIEQLEMPKVVLVTPSREIDWDYLVRFGEIINELSEKEGIRIAFVASADQAHTHDKNGPYGYDEAAKIFDEIIIEIAKENKLGELLKIRKDIIDRAKPDSFWQLLIMYGAIKGAGLSNILNVYHCPTYFGMLVSVFV